MSRSSDQIGQELNAIAEYQAKVYAVMIVEMTDWIWNGRPKDHPIGQLDVPNTENQVR